MAAGDRLQRPDLPALTPVQLGDEHSGEELILSGAEVQGGATAARRIRLTECELRGVTITGPQAPGLILRDVVARDCALSNLDAHDAQFSRAELTACRLVGLSLTRSELRDVRITDSTLQLASFAGARIRDAVLEGVNLTDTSFMGARLEGVAFIGCTLAGTDFRDARLEGCAIRDASLQDVLGVSALRGVRMPWPDILASAGALADALGIRIDES